MEAELPILAIVLIVVMAGDAAAGAVPIAYIKDDLDRLNVSEQTQRLIPLLKFAAVAGLVIGLWVPVLGLITCVALLGYFVAALWVHKRENDPLVKYLPAVGFFAFIAVVGALSYLPAL